MKILPVLFLAAFATCTTARVEPISAPELAARCTVKVTTTTGHGSGAVLGANGTHVFILTSAHVVGDFELPVVEVHQHPTVDAALLVVASDQIGDTLVPRYEPVRPGEDLYSAGFPLNMALQVGRGQAGDGPVASMPMAPGMSGGPIVDAEGRLVGIVQGYLGLGPTWLQTHTWFVPLADLREWLSSLVP